MNEETDCYENSFSANLINWINSDRSEQEKCIESFLVLNNKGKWKKCDTSQKINIWKQIEISKHMAVHFITCVFPFLYLHFHLNRCQFHQCSTCSFYACWSQKRKKNIDTLTVIFTHFWSAHAKAARRTLMKLSPGTRCCR